MANNSAIMAKCNEIRLKRVVMLSFGLIFNESEAESSQEADGAPPDHQNPHEKSKNYKIMKIHWIS